MDENNDQTRKELEIEAIEIIKKLTDEELRIIMEEIKK